MAQRLDEGLVRRERLLGAAAEQHGGAVGVGAAAELGDQAGLADPRLAADQEHARLAPARPFPRRREGAQRLRPSDERALVARELGRQRDLAAAGGLPLQLPRRHRSREPLERQLADRREAVAAPGADERPHDVRGQDLAALGAVAQAPGHHHGGAEVVVFVADRLARMQPDAHRQRRARFTPVVALDRLLDADRAAGGVDAAGEGDHEAVAEALDLAPGVCERDVAQDREVRPPQPLGVVVAEGVEQLGRAHEVGEEQGDGAGGRRWGEGAASASRSSACSARVAGEGATPSSARRRSA